MAIRQLGPGGPTYDYSGRDSLSAPHTVLSKLKVLTVNVNIASIAADATLAVSVAFPAGSFSNRAICLAMAPPLALEANVLLSIPRVSAADTVVFEAENETAVAIDPAAADYMFVILEP